MVAANIKKDDADKVNEGIMSDKVRLVDAEGNMVGVLSKSEALSRAYDEGLDLVVIASGVSPPVCKIVDYGKLKYANQKKAKKSRKNQKVIETKELKLRWVIQERDYNIKLDKAREFLRDGDHVKFMMRFRGREVVFKNKGFELFDKICTDLEEIGKVHSMSNRQDTESKQIYMIIVPVVTGVAK